MPGPVRIVPLGGLGEIGLNMLLVEAEGAAIAVDCGVLFPERPGLGVDLLLPDVTYLRERPGLLRAVVLTHGHEDHIGALPRLLAEMPVPVFGPRLAAALAQEKLRRDRISVPVETIAPGQSFSIGPFAIEPIHMTHSIVDAVALAIDTPQGTILHSGDFKIDPRPVDGRASDLARVEEIGRRGVLLLLSDSTNVEHEGECGSESDVGPRIEELIRGTRGRVLLTTFASHLHRVQQVVDASLRAGRRIAIAGRGFEDSVRLAGELGYLKVPASGLVGLDEACRLDARATTVLISGSQGEPTSALARLSDGQYKQLTVGEGDAVILSSRIIPGNERSVHALLNRLSKRGAEIHYGSRAGVHVSGHAYRSELRTMLQLVRPRYFVPVHGEYRQLEEHRRLAADTGLVPLDRCLLLEDGDVLEIDDAGARTGERVVVGRVLVDGTGEGDVDFEVLRDRRHLSEDGFVVAVIAIHQQTGEITSGPELITRGVSSEDEDSAYLDEAKAAVVEKLREITPESRADLLEVEDEVRRVLKRYFAKTRGRRPLIVPHVFEM
ncbi:MAG TPA: ribonuclease J [Candidatus Binatia bacterium]|nr:ribonuclease J [Candidatus Binatia bacterium]